MVGKARALVSTTAARLAHAIDDEVVTYTPQALNDLISTIAAREVAGRLRECAAWHREQAAAERDRLQHLPGNTFTVAAATNATWHDGEAARLDMLAARELAGIERGEVR